MTSLPIPILSHAHAATSATAPASAGALATAGAAPAPGGSSTLAGSIPANMQISQSGFLQLISTQMQNQDPLNPTDPTQFLTQIEGLSEVSSLQGLQSSIAGLSSGLQGAQVLSGTSLLGHSVLAPGSTARLAAGGTVTGAVSAPSGTSALQVAVTDASGALVDSFQVAPQASGYSAFSWNGMTSQGRAAAPGNYSLQVTAAVGNTSQSLSPLLYSKVTSVTIDPASSALQLNTANGTVPLSSVVSIQ
ncbi:MAG TPA: FlgD immunoglobulin-like domain containing protein [Steroidobacteraceae bacterium]|nr:FlgD immunoglobulin-like domain containing protein [Steroidobacteraceae bacterium]